MKRISILDAKPGMAVAKTVYSRDGRILLNVGKKLTETYINKMTEIGVPTLYIQAPEGTDNSLKANLYEEVRELPDTISFATRLEAEKVLSDISGEVKNGRIFDLDPVHNVVEKIIQEIITSKQVIGKLADIRILDDYTFAHSVNVCIMALAIGSLLNYPPAKLYDLGIGALLHDVGKLRVPEEILQKPASLTVEEFAEIKKHPLDGYNLLREHPNISLWAASVAYQHHERVDGLGYPRGLKGNQINEFSKIVAIADVYDALTANRVYKNMVLPYEAIEIIIASSNQQFEPELVKLFVENISIYPVGSRVELNNGATGVVIRNNRNLPTRPVVRLLTNAEGEPVRDVEIDLVTNITIFVNKVLSFKNPNL